jgi:hypothetical protein
MKTENQGDERFERRAREVFDSSVDGLDARTRSRLNQARQAATEEVARSHGTAWRMWAPAGALAAAALIAVLLWHGPQTGTQPQQQAQQRVRTTPVAADPVEILAAGDDVDLGQEDLDFYEWVALETTEPGNGVG